MLVEKPILHKAAEQAIIAMERDGLHPTPSDVLWLNHVAGQCLTPELGAASLLDFPIEVGGVFLWPLTIGARLWYQQHAEVWFRGKEPIDTLAMAFAMAHSRQPEILSLCVSPFATKVRIFWWASGLRATVREIQAVVERLISGDTELVRIKSVFHKPPADVKASEWGEAVALLCHFYQGTTPDYWLWQAGDGKVNDAIAQVAMKKGWPDGKPSSAAFAAMSTMEEVVLCIRNRLQEEAKQDAESPAH